MPEIDMVAWDFGDTLVDEQIMRVCPPGVPDWAAALNEVLGADGWADGWSLGRVSMNELVVPLSERLPMSPNQIARHLRVTWRSPRMLEPAVSWLHRLRGVVTQVIVTVNPHEFHGIAAATGLDLLADLIVTSADLRDASKVSLAREARRRLGLDEDLATTLLVDNRADNVREFRDNRGQAVLFAEGDPLLDQHLLPLLR